MAPLKHETNNNACLLLITDPFLLNFKSQPENNKVMTSTITLLIGTQQQHIPTAKIVIDQLAV